MKLDKPILSLADRIYKAIKDNTNDAPRYHLGASLIGHSCDRWLWLSFRWAIQEEFDGRMLRLFRRGQDEEEKIINDLRLAGLDIDAADKNGKQFHVSIIPHFGGSMDGVVNSGVPEAPEKKHVLEIKTHSLKSFNDLVKNGVQKSKPMHYAQMQVYMHGTGIDRALYVAVCKDNDRIYTERVRYSMKDAERLVKKADYIINSGRMVEPVSADPSWYECKFCPAAYEFCHQNDKSQIKTNCRTCRHVSVEGDSFVCCLHGDAIPNEAQLGQWDCYERHGDLC